MIQRMTNQLGEFLRARRESVQPHEVGLAAGPSRRVPGLRREEVAALASISPDYYLRIEQGRVQRPSEQVLLGLAEALRLDDSGRRYIFRLARPTPFIRRVEDDPPAIGDAMNQLLSHWSHTPAYVTDSNQNILASNLLMEFFSPNGLHRPGSNLLVGAFEGYSDFLAEPVTDPREAEAIAAQWEGTLRELTAPLHYYGTPDDPVLQAIVGTLSARHAVFRTIWAEHTAKPQMAGVKRVDIPQLGWVEFRWQTFEIPMSAQFLTIFFGEAGSSAAAAIAYLAAQAPSHRTAGSSLQAVPDPALSKPSERLAAGLSSSTGVKMRRESPSAPGTFRRL